MKLYFNILLSLLFFQKISGQNYEYEWAKTIPCANNDVGYSIVADALGNVYVTGYFNGTADFDPSPTTFNLSSSAIDIFLAKYSDTGNLIWAKKIGGSQDDISREIFVDASGNIFLTGIFQSTVDFDPSVGNAVLSSAGSFDIFMAKYDNNGNYIWAKGMGGPANDYGIFFDFDSSGNIYLTGDFNSTVDLDPSAATVNFTTNGARDAYIAKYDSNGNFIFGKSFGGTGEDSGQCLRVDGNGDFYVVGNFYNTVDFDPSVTVLNLTSNGSQDIFISKFDTNGNLILAHKIGGTGEDYCKHMDLDQLNNYVIAGYYSSTCDFDPSAATSILTSTGDRDVYIAKFSTTGNYIWAKSMGGTGFDWALSLIINQNDDIFIAGLFENIADFDPSPTTLNLTSSGSNDAFFAKYNSSGNMVFAKKAGGNGLDRAYSIFTDNSNDVFLTGLYNSTSDFDPSISTANLSSAGGNEIFIAKYSVCVFADTPTLSASQTSICSNSPTTLTINSGNLNNSISWSWYTGSCGGTFIGTGTSIVVTPTVTTTYYVRGEGGCSSSGNCASIIINTVSQTIANAGPDQNICSTTATLAGNVPTNGTGIWSVISGSASITNINSATSTVTGIIPGSSTVLRWVINNSICLPSMDDITIISSTAPTIANAGIDISICGSTAILSGNAPIIGTGTWSLVSGSGTISNINNPTTNVNGLSQPVSVFRWTISHAACTISTSDLVSITVNVNNTTINPRGNISICADSIITLDAGTGYVNYIWFPIGNTKSITTSKSGTYKVKTTDLNGCTDEDSVVVLVQDKIIVKAIPDTIICENQEIILKAIGASSYTWSPSLFLNTSSGNEVICNPATSIDYVVKGMVKECVGYDTLSLFIIPNPTIELGNNYNAGIGDEIKLNAITDSLITWYPKDNLSCSDCKTPIYFADTTTTFYATTANEKGCIAKDSVTVYVDYENRVYMPNSFTPNGDFTNDVYKIVTYGILNYTMEIYDRWGELIYKWNEKEKGWDGTYKGTVAKQDIYIFIFNAEDFKNKKINISGNISLIR